MESRNMDSNGVMSSSACEKLLNGLEQTGKNSVFESTTNGFINQNGDDDDRSDSFILDIDGFDRDMITPNNSSRFTKSLSRKGSGLEKKTNEIVVTTCSPRAGPGSPVLMANTSNHPQIITITSSAETKWRSNSFRHSSSFLGFHPRRILFFFATLSSMGTMILIYFTLSITKLNQGTLN